ncbi:glycosyltransferase involved in cell wall biosynthesis [Rhodoblastus acidophilus]|uniref:glycosyltransferase family 4 protein n=1 Tax=Rhodoblastus acidophilus TaxID=1074 RepID=UPI00222555F8|nr:glycosyltransferase family 4 protein [Rhodoblastus acidophilus]MCW2283836.1 glycosyltransferase involved in cell wall biosynthesis [Rhodoblastus acidophilus]MCW2332532.1 glycosyltransferase involved in cell wall biosynthesis [Rhodoblastus acidophilus]
MSSTRTGKSCVIVVENLPVPLDRRVWQEAQALRRAGLQVSVICPATVDYPARFEILDGVEIHRHPLPLQARGRCGFVIEYAAALYHEARLLLRIHRRRGVDVIQACNPPDLIVLAALPLLAMGARFIFDQHDLCPELYEAKFSRRGPFYWLLRAAERFTYACADQVVTANDAFREVALARGAKGGRVASVYSYPDTTWLRARKKPQAVKDKPVLGYLGVIGDQDGVDGLVRAVDHLVHVDAFTDFRALVVGDGPALGGVAALAHDLRVDDYITFTGFLTGEKLAAQLAAFDIGLIPDPLNPSNDRMSMNKVFEYCALGVPTVAFPLVETRRLLGDAGVYAKGGRPQDLAEATLPLLRDNALRAALAEGARRRSARFDWAREAQKYLRVYDRCLGLPQPLAFEERRGAGVLLPGE